MNSRIVRVTQDIESRCQEMEERSRHQMRCSELLRRELDPLTAADVPMLPHIVPGSSSPASDGLSLNRREVEEPPVPRVRVHPHPLGGRATYTNM